MVKEGFCLSVCRYRYQEVICDDNVDLMGGENVQWIDGEKDAVLSLMRVADDLDVLQKLTAAVPYLSEAEQAIVQYILQHPTAVVDMSSSQLAEVVGVSQATLFRLCRRLSFTGYAALRNEIENSLAKYGERFVIPTLASDTRNDGLNPLQTAIYAGIRSLVDVGSMPLEQLTAAARKLAAAARVHICGLGPISGRLAEMTAFTFQRLGLPCMLWIDVQALQEEYDRFERDDVVLALSHSGANAQIAQFLKRANEESAVTIALVNYPGSIIATEAQIALVTHTRESKVQKFELLPRLPQLIVLQVLGNLVGEQLASSTSD